MAILLGSSESEVALAARLIRGGELVAFPTETVYGLGADATNDDAVRKIFAAKGRPAHNPLIVHVANAEAACKWAREWPDRAQLLADEFWPGPITLVVQAGSGISRFALAGGGTVGLRAPAHAVAMALLDACDLPLAAPSANSSGLLSPVEARHVMDDLGPRIAAVIDGGRCDVGIESTVVDLTGRSPVMLRHGMISREQIESVLGVSVELFAGKTGTELRSPGMLEKHYAPRIPLRVKSRHQLRLAPGDVAVITFDSTDSSLDIGNVHVLPSDPKLAARNLYALLWKLQTGHAREIWIESIPESPGWEAVRDRLRRASI